MQKMKEKHEDWLCFGLKNTVYRQESKQQEMQHKASEATMQ